MQPNVIIAFLDSPDAHIITANGVFDVDVNSLQELSEYHWCGRNDNGGKIYGQANIVREDGKRTMLQMHRLLMDAKPGEIIDHINGDTQDNHLYNLRICTALENSWNMVKYRGTSKYKGVSWNKNNKRWCAQIGYKGKSIYIGKFDTENDAARAYNAMAKYLYEGFARLNEVA